MIPAAIQCQIRKVGKHVLERRDAGGRQHFRQLEHAAHVFAALGEVVLGQAAAREAPKTVRMR